VFYTSSGRASVKKLLNLTCASIAIAIFTHSATLPAAAQSYERGERSFKKQKYVRKQKPQAAQPVKLAANGPLTMTISLNQQRMFVYDANGLVTETQVSTGTTGHETPKGIYSILEKKRDHASNIYAGAPMPHMQRLLMTGIAMHGGVVPGYPASHGCVRLPFDFARRFFELTDVNQRVIIAPDVHSPVEVEHASLFSALPSSASLTVPGDRADGAGATAVKVAEAVLGVGSAHAATEPPGRTLESAAEARRDERVRLAAAIDEAIARGKAAEEGVKSAGKAVSDARDAAKKVRVEAGKLAREASKAKSALQSQDRTLKKIAQRLEKESGKLRADKLEELRAAQATEQARIAPATEEAERAAAAAQAAQDAIKAADEAVTKAQSDLKASKDEIKAAAAAEKSAKADVARFDRLEQFRDLPVSVFISTATGTVAVRQGFERVLEMPVTIENPEQPLDTFLFTAVDWKDASRTGLRWTALEVNENSTGIPGLDEDSGSRKKKNKVKAEAKRPEMTEAAKAQSTLDRIKIPQEAAARLAELVKPGSTMIVSSYNVSKSETRYAGTDFIVQMPEVVAKITKPTPPKKPVEVVEESSGGCFFFCSSYSNDKPSKKRQKMGGKSSVW
jgi:hypothetical protein